MPTVTRPQSYSGLFLLLCFVLTPACETEQRNRGDDDDSAVAGDDDSAEAPPSPQTIELVAAEDAVIRSVGQVGDGTNYGQEQYNNAQAWTNTNDAVIQQSLMAFDLSELPLGADVSAATLMLYSDPGSSQYPDGHDRASGSNESTVARITSDWSASAVTWNSKPSTDSNHQATIAESSFAFEDKAIDVKAMVQDMVNEPQSSFGFHFHLNVEIPYRRMVFASIDHPSAELHPRLSITYID